METQTAVRNAYILRIEVNYRENSITYFTYDRDAREWSESVHRFPGQVSSGRYKILTDDEGNELKVPKEVTVNTVFAYFEMCLYNYCLGQKMTSFRDTEGYDISDRKFFNDFEKVLRFMMPDQPVTVAERSIRPSGSGEVFIIPYRPYSEMISRKSGSRAHVMVSDGQWDDALDTVISRVKKISDPELRNELINIINECSGINVQDIEGITEQDRFGEIINKEEIDTILLPKITWFPLNDDQDCYMGAEANIVCFGEAFVKNRRSRNVLFVESEFGRGKTWGLYLLYDRLMQMNQVIKPFMLSASELTAVANTNIPVFSYLKSRLGISDQYAGTVDRDVISVLRNVKQHIVVIIDGLDEISAVYYKSIRRDITMLSSELSNIKFILSSRNLSTFKSRDDKAFEALIEGTVHLELIDNKAILEICRARFPEIRKGETCSEGEKLAKDVMDFCAVEQSASTPLIISTFMRIKSLEDELAEKPEVIRSAYGDIGNIGRIDSVYKLFKVETELLKSHCVRSGRDGAEYEYLFPLLAYLYRKEFDLGEAKKKLFRLQQIMLEDYYDVFDNTDIITADPSDMISRLKNAGLFTLNHIEYRKYLASRFIVKRFEREDDKATVLSEVVYETRYYRENGEMPDPSLRTRMLSYGEYSYLGIREIYSSQEIDSIYKKLLLLGLNIGFEKGVAFWNAVIDQVEAYMEHVKYTDPNGLDDDDYRIMTGISSFVYTVGMKAMRKDIIDIILKYQNALKDLTESTDSNGQTIIYDRINHIRPGFKGALLSNIGASYKNLFRADNDPAHLRDAIRFHRLGFEEKMLYKDSPLYSEQEKRFVSLSRSFIALAEDCMDLGVIRKSDELLAEAAEKLTEALECIGFKWDPAAGRLTKTKDSISAEEEQVDGAEPFVPLRMLANCYLELWKNCKNPTRSPDADKNCREDYRRLYISALSAAVRSIREFCTRDGKIDYWMLRDDRAYREVRVLYKTVSENSSHRLLLSQSLADDLLEAKTRALLDQLDDLYKTMLSRYDSTPLIYTIEYRSGELQTEEHLAEEKNPPEFHH